MAPTLYERVTCEDVRVGDSIARAKTHEFFAVEAIHEGPLSRRLIFNNRPGRYDRRPYGFNICPRRTAKLWRIVEQPTLPGV